jgi:hypothetical protein
MTSGCLWYGSPQWQLHAVVVDTDRKFTTSVTVITVRIRKDVTAGVVDTNVDLLLVSLTLLEWWCTLSFEYLREFS